MNNSREEANCSGADEENAKFHTVQPLRDLESNWGVDLAKNLEEYLLKICSGEITSENYDDGHHLSVNFAEAALLLQGSVQVYSRKVEYLYSLVVHALEFITKKSEPDLPASGSAQADENGLPVANQEEDDPFWVSEEIPVEAKNMLDDTVCRDSFTQFVKAPANLVVLEGDCLDVTGDAGELESYLLATCDLYRDFILLDACDSATVDCFLDSENIAGKGLNNSSKGSSLKSKYHKSFSSPTGLSGGAGNKSSARKNQDANLYQSPRGHEFDPVNLNNDPHEFDPGNLNNDPFSSDIPDNIDDAHGYSEPRDLDDSDDEDPWKPLNPHEPGNLKVKSYKKVKSNRRQGVVSRKLASLATEFPLARLHGTINTDLNEMWERRCCAMNKQVDAQSPPPFEKLRESLLHGVNNDYDDFYTPNEKNEDNDYDSADHDFGPPDFDMPENADMNNNATPHGEKHDNCGPLFDSEAHEDLNGQENLEDLCRSHLDSLLANLAETEKQTELAARVSTWKQRIDQNLEEQESHPPFDIHEYGARVLNKLSLEENDKSTMSFSDVVKGSEKHDIARTFSALLQLVNNGDVALERGEVCESTCYTAANPFSVQLLRHGNGREEMQFQSSKKRVKSPMHNQNIRKEKNKGKAVHAAVDSSPSGPNSDSRIPLKLGRVNGTRCTPESKKRRKSRIALASDVPTAL
ncbi:condensin-2 complex subunit H2 isoform X1 [Solanum stenotomum]|uniref:condensin-2 complex subunit H2 isoform X1 n=1 Tax=Solanum stenotomum TaxID=172797 RepID=UPI0020D02F85|nr:condensin-2 complex subunit H2 isoform X1 [Solanum stenotomum]